METITANKKQAIRIALALFFSILFTASAFSQRLKVAVAANLQPVIGELQKDFAKQTECFKEVSC